MTHTRPQIHTITENDPILVECLHGDGCEGRLLVTYGTTDQGEELVLIADGQTRWVGPAAGWRQAVAELVGATYESAGDWYSRACSDTPLVCAVYGCGGLGNDIETVARVVSAGLINAEAALILLARGAQINAMSEDDADALRDAIDDAAAPAEAAALIRALPRPTA